MKKLILSAAILFAGLSGTDAQTDQSTVLLGGGITFVSAEATRFTASPSIGLFVLDDVAVIGKFSLEVTEGTGARWAIGPSIRLYLFGTDSGKLITQVGVNVGGAKGTDTDFGFDIGAGYAIFLNESIALELLANYIRTGDTKGIFSIGVGFQLHYDR